MAPTRPFCPCRKPTEVKGSTFPPRPKAPAPAETLVHSKAPPPAETLGDKLAAYFIRYRVSNIDRHRLVAHRLRHRQHLSAITPGRQSLNF